jgi:hypothetical protein
MSNHKRRKIVELLEIAHILAITMDDHTLADSLERAADKARAGITVPKPAARPARRPAAGTRRPGR